MRQTLHKKKVRRTTPAPNLRSEVSDDFFKKYNVTLNTLLRLANSKLKDDEPFTPETVYRYYRRRDPGRRDPDRSMGKHVDSMHRLPPDAQEWLSLSFDGQYIEGFIGQVRKCLRDLGEANREKVANPIIFGKPCYLFDGKHIKGKIGKDCYLTSAPDGSVSEKGKRKRRAEGKKLKCIRDPVLNYLDGIELERIKECTECKKMFWAGRTDQKCCSPECHSRRRVRKWREKYPEDYKLRYD